jgi:small subunit ribosomal protein S6
MPLYETVFIARQDMTPAQVDELTAATAKIITDGQGKILKTDNWGLRTLAYKIKKNRKGYYVLFNMDAPADAMLEMERQIRLNEDVLRYMTIRVDEFIDETKTNHDEEREAA